MRHPNSLLGRVLLTALLLAIAGCGGGGGSNLTQCGNGRIDGGEQCDDGNVLDSDTCTAVCREARCGDGAIQFGIEACDGTNLGNSQNRCAELGYAPGENGRPVAACALDCASLDVSVCGPKLTPTPPRPTATVTRTPTASPTPVTTTCGDGLLESGETCDTCPDDCVAAACTPSGANAIFSVTVAGARTPQTASVQLAYRTSVLGLPGSGNDVSVRQRVRAAPPIPSSFVVTDLEYAVDIQAMRMAGLGSPLATARFDVCDGAPPATVDDLSCVVLACTDASGTVPNCRCTVAAQP
jgi:cysteine-rich repeat protein